MIIWLASYPRSGNTLLRQIFWQVFDHPTYSDSNDPKDLGIHEAGATLVGHRNYTPPWSDFYSAARKASTLNLVKTHHPPRDAGKTIYIVRDGRAALVQVLRESTMTFGKNPSCTRSKLVSVSTLLKAVASASDTAAIRKVYYRPAAKSQLKIQKYSQHIL
jgi:hypothetical protein